MFFNKKNNEPAILMFNHVTGECIGYMGENFSTGGGAGVDTILIAYETLAIAKNSLDKFHPSRILAAKGKVVGSFQESDIFEWIEMSTGDRYFYDGTNINATHQAFEFGPGDLMLGTGIVYRKA